MYDYSKKITGLASRVQGISKPHGRRVPFTDFKLLKKIGEGKKYNLRTYRRCAMIFPQFVGLTIEVHCGNKFAPVYVTAAMVGHKLGEFAATRKFGGHPDKKKNDPKAKAKAKSGGKKK